MFIRPPCLRGLTKWLSGVTVRLLALFQAPWIARYYWEDQNVRLKQETHCPNTTSDTGYCRSRNFKVTAKTDRLDIS